MTPTRCEHGSDRTAPALPGRDRQPSPCPEGEAGESLLAEVETERLLLRQVMPEDLDESARIFGDARVTKYLGLRGETQSKGETEVILRSITAHWARHGFGRWAAVHKRDGRLIGYCGLRAFGENAELVYLLDHPYWGRGLATEMARACLTFGFEERAFDFIVSMARPGNAASRRVMEKVGMEYRQTVQFFKYMAALGIQCGNLGGCEDFDVVQYMISRAVYRRVDGRR